MPTHKTATEVAEILSSYINSASSQEVAELASEMSHDHRTLVQKKMSLFLKFAKILATHKENGRYDMRNEYSCDLSSKIMKLTDGMTETPFI